MAAKDLMMLHRHPFVKVIAASLRDRCGVGPGDRVVLAVSGGADSAAMAHALAAIAGRGEWSLDAHIAHIHHHLREDADGDEAFVSELAASLGLPFHRVSVRPADAPGNIESNARRMRYEALADIAEGMDADAVATAHHADDQLETVLMRLIRGASIQGLAGIAPRRRLRGRCELIRPMLGTDHAAATAFLKEIDRPWREDPTNADRSLRRNRLRADVLPVLRDLRSDAAVKATETADQVRDASRLTHRLTRAAERRHVTVVSDHEARMARETARRLPRALLSALVRRRCRMAGASGDALGGRVIGPIVRAMRDGRGETRTFDLSGGVRVTVAAGEIRWSGRR